MEKYNNMEELNAILLDWTKHFIKYKDAIHKNIKNIKKGNKNTLTIEYKNKTEYIFAKSKIDNGYFNEIISKINSSKEKNCFFVISCYNTKENLNNLIANWERIINFTNVTVIFSNPNSTKEEKWLLKPNMHNKIIEKGRLKQSLITLFLNVDEFKFKK